MSAIPWDHWSERWRRFVCRQVEHDFRQDSSGAPVIPLFVVCRRCGNFYRVTDALPVAWWRRAWRRLWRWA